MLTAVTSQLGFILKKKKKKKFCEKLIFSKNNFKETIVSPFQVWIKIGFSLKRKWNNVIIWLEFCMHCMKSGIVMESIVDSVEN